MRELIVLAGKLMPIMKGTKSNDNRYNQAKGKENITCKYIALQSFQVSTLVLYKELVKLSCKAEFLYWEYIL